MIPQEGETYIINGETLRCKKVRDSGIHTFELPSGEVRNEQGHVSCFGLRLIRQDVFDQSQITRTKIQ